MSWLDAILLGVVQGLTEFLPISSTAHLLFCRQLLGHRHPEDAFTTIVQLGTLLAVMWYFRTDIYVLIRAVLLDFRTWKFGSSPESRLAWLIVLGTIPAVLVGGLLKKYLKEHFYNLIAMGIVSIVFALLMMAAEGWHKRRREDRKPDREVTDVGWLDALWVGLWQALALMPGGSRSGTTITAGLFAGFSRSAAARFSFLLSLPVMVGAGAKELYDEYKKLKVPEGSPSLFASADEMTALLIGLVVSAVVGYLAIAWLLHYLRRRSMMVFVIYRLLLGAALLAAVAWKLVPSRP